MKLLKNKFLLHSDTAKVLYYDYADKLPVIDYHNHLNPADIANDRKYENMTELWLDGDHYKWRLMRWAGVEEEFITGNAKPLEKFLKWAAVLEKAIGNPVYLWSCLELQRYFGVNEPLTADSAERIYNDCNEQLSVCTMSVRGLIEQSEVEYLCTTDDPVDTLEWHKKIAADNTIRTIIAPAFRPDKVLTGYPEYIEKLSNASGISMKNQDDVKAALINRMDYFAEHGCTISDHSIEDVAWFDSDIMLFLAREYTKRGWVMQLHYGCHRSANSRMVSTLGENTGFDCISNNTPAAPLIDFLNALEKTNELPKTILYSLNPNDNQVLASIAGSFQQSGVVGKVQHGAAWWFNDNQDGITEHLRSFANIGYLPSFIGMLTDGRSFLSLSRHEYFRRILCNLLGEYYNKGEWFGNIATLGKIVGDISYHNAKKYFNV